MLDLDVGFIVVFVDHSYGLILLRLWRLRSYRGSGIISEGLIAAFAC